MTSAVEPRRADNVKLPLWDTIRLSYTSYFLNFADVLRISWLWLVVLIPLTSIAVWGQFSWMVESMANLKRGAPAGTLQASRSFESIALGNAFLLVFILAGVGIAVAWHRCMILGEHPRLSGSNLASKNLWRYVGVGLAILLILVLIVVVPSALILLPIFFISRSAAQPLILLGALFGVLFYLAAIAIMLRLIPLLPARAVGNRNLTFKQTWNGTRGNTWRIFWGLVACALPPALLPQLASLGLIGFPNPGTVFSPAFTVRFAIIDTIFIIYHLLTVPISIGFLSFSYRHFFERT